MATTAAARRLSWLLISLNFSLVMAACGRGGQTSDQTPESIRVVSRNGPDSNWPEVMYFPDAQGQPQPGKVLGEGDFVPATIENVTFTLYTRRGPTEGEALSIGDAARLRGSTFNDSQPTIILTHGFLSGIQSKAIKRIKNTYIGSKDRNVVAVDWSGIASNPLYFIAKRQTVPVGGFVAQFVTFLVRHGGVDLRNVHLVGHSLGAHVMGIAGKRVMRNLHSKVDRITGLDPSGPLFSLTNGTHRLDRHYAQFVDVIHTCGGWLGIAPPIGHADFFPNGGSVPQPGCPLDLVRGSICAHNRAWMYFAESINTSNFTSRPADSYEDFLKNSSSLQLEAAVSMGERVAERIDGKYYLTTAASWPFALG